MLKISLNTCKNLARHAMNHFVSPLWGCGGLLLLVSIGSIASYLWQHVRAAEITLPALGDRDMREVNWREKNIAQHSTLDFLLHFWYLFCPGPNFM